MKRIPALIAGLTALVLAIGTGTAVARSASGPTTHDRLKAARQAVLSAQRAIRQANSALILASRALNGALHSGYGGLPTPAPSSSSSSSSSSAAPVASSSAAAPAPVASSSTSAPAPSAPASSAPASSATPSSPPTGSAANVGSTLPPGNWTLDFSDEFNGNSVDTSTWGTKYPWGSGFNTGNSEDQCYVPGALSEGNGQLTITATRQQTTCQGAGSQVTKDYSSGMIQSAGSHTFTYGYAEIRAKLPGATSTWPAFWLLPANYSWPPEFDVFEGWGQHDGSGNLDRITQTYIWPNGSGGSSNAQTQLTGTNFSQWHTYGVDWEPGSLTFYVDGVAQASYTNNVPSQPMYLLANLAMQGGAGSSGPASAQMEVDYIRVFKKA